MACKLFHILLVRMIRFYYILLIRYISVSLLHLFVVTGKTCVYYCVYRNHLMRVLGRLT